MSRTLSAKIDSELKRELEEIAKAEGRSLSNLVSLFLRRGVHTHRASCVTKFAKGG